MSDIDQPAETFRKRKPSSSSDRVPPSGARAGARAGARESEPENTADQSGKDTDRKDSRKEKDEEDGAAIEKRRAFFHYPIVMIAGGAVLLAVIVVAVLWWLQARDYETTDDAFIDAHIVRVSSQIAGQLTTINVQDNQLVHAGDLLVEIDSSDPQSRVDQVIAQTAQAQTALAEAQAQIRVADANHQQALAAAAAAKANAGKAAQDLTRYRSLMALNKAAVAQAQMDQVEAEARNTAAQAAAAVSQAKAIEAQRAAAEAQAQGAQAQIGALKAQVSQAQISLGHTRIVAPVSGHIAQRNAAAGNYVSPGQQLMAIIPLDLWVTANFKETQLADIRIGQHVDISVDACPNATISGHVDSIQRGAGQAFGILPPENATGNFVKVVQRVPLKIVLDSVPADCPLGPGMSVEPSVKVR